MNSTVSSEIRSEPNQQQAICRASAAVGIRMRIIAVIVPLAFWLVLTPQYMFMNNRVSPDSAAYIDCARSIREGRGFQTRVYGGLEPRTWEPIRLWPPGYPALVAAAMTLGLSPYTAALAVSIVCSGVFVILVLSFFAQRFPVGVAIAIGLVFVSICTLGEMFQSRN